MGDGRTRQPCRQWTPQVVQWAQMAIDHVAPTVSAVLLVLASVPTARAEVAPLRLTVVDERLLANEGYGRPCPTLDQAAEQLRELLPQDAPLRTGAQEEQGAVPTAWIRDRGRDYRIEVLGQARTVHDPARDCLARAQVAAVFIALNWQSGSVRKGEHTVAPSPIRAGLAGAAELALGAPGPAGGGGLGLWLRREPWQLTLTFAWLSPVPIGQSPELATSDAVALTRLPCSLDLYYAFGRGLLRGGPLLGVGMDVLHLRGQGVPEAQIEVRLNPGARLGVRTDLALTDDLSIFLAGGAAAQLRVYRLQLRPSVALGTTPRLWAFARMGLSHAF